MQKSSKNNGEFCQKYTYASDDEGPKWIQKSKKVVIEFGSEKGENSLKNT